LETVVTEIGLDDINAGIDNMLQGKHKGRTIVRLFD
jgi:D-arabinose 1-dehydrogenase-like Zn-dependent alcohol dehydrogenase